MLLFGNSPRLRFEECKQPSCLLFWLWLGSGLLLRLLFKCLCPDGVGHFSALQVEQLVLQLNDL